MTTFQVNVEIAVDADDAEGARRRVQDLISENSDFDFTTGAVYDESGVEPRSESEDMLADEQDSDDRYMIQVSGASESWEGYSDLDTATRAFREKFGGEDADIPDIDTLRDIVEQDGDYTVFIDSLSISARLEDRERN